MGAYPSAKLLFGIDIGEWEWDADGALPWWTKDAEDEGGDHVEAAKTVLDAAGIEGVDLEWYGNAYAYAAECSFYALALKRIGIDAYEARRLTPLELAVNVNDIKRLKDAWELLFGDRAHEEPGWIGVVSYG